MKFKIAILSIALSLGCASGALAKSMSEADFKSKVAGKTWKWTKDGAHGTIKYSKSGKVRVTIKGANKFKDTGKWRWKGSKLCSQYKIVRKGKNKCFGISFSGKGLKTSDGGKMFR